MSEQQQQQPQQQQQKLFCTLFDEFTLEYLKKLLKDMTVKGEDTPLHATAYTQVFRSELWPTVLNSIREQMKQEGEGTLVPPPPSEPVQ